MRAPRVLTAYSYSPERTITVSSGAPVAGATEVMVPVGAGDGRPGRYTCGALSGALRAGIESRVLAGVAGRLKNTIGASTTSIIRPTAARKRRSIGQVRVRGPHRPDGTGGTASGARPQATTPAGVHTWRRLRAHRSNMKDKTGTTEGRPAR